MRFVCEYLKVFSIFLFLLNSLYGLPSDRLFVKANPSRLNKFPWLITSAFIFLLGHSAVFTY